MKKLKIESIIHAAVLLGIVGLVSCNNYEENILSYNGCIHNHNLSESSVCVNQNISDTQANLSWFNTETSNSPNHISSKKTFELTKAAAEQGSLIGMNNLGVFYQKGIGTPVNKELGVIWYQKAANNNYAPAQMNLGYALFYGLGVNKNVEKAIYWTTQSAKQGNLEAMSNLGVMYQKMDIPSAAVFWTEKAAQQGQPMAQANLGYLYATGYGVEVDSSKAKFYLRKSMEQNNSQAFFIMGVLHSQPNKAFTINYKLAFDFYQKASQLNHGEAQYNLANFFMRGQHIPKDEKMAISLYEKSAYNQIPEAILALSQIYELGTDDIKPDIEKSNFWKKKLMELKKQ